MKSAIKICGIRSEEALECSERSGATHIGFNFYPQSPRFIEIDDAASLARKATGIIIVALTVDADDKTLEHIAKSLKPNLFQLHGTEPPERVATIRKEFHIPVMKVVAIESHDDIAVARKFEPIADWLLFDARPGDLPGGNGLTFDWQIIASEKWAKPWMLSGGLTPANVAAAIHHTKAPGVDVASGVEKPRGTKDMSLISAFISNAKAAFSDLAQRADQIKK